MLSSLWNLTTGANITNTTKTPIALNIQQLPLGSQIPKGLLDWTTRFDGSVGALQKAASSREIELPPSVPGTSKWDMIVRVRDAQVCFLMKNGFGTTLYDSDLKSNRHKYSGVFVISKRLSAQQGQPVVFVLRRPQNEATSSIPTKRAASYGPAATRSKVGSEAFWQTATFRGAISCTLGKNWMTIYSMTQNRIKIGA